jgi:hypothetical protein
VFIKEYYSDDEIKKGEVGGPCGKWGEQKYITCLVEKVKEREHLEKLFVGNGII